MKANFAQRAITLTILLLLLFSCQKDKQVAPQPMRDLTGHNISGIIQYESEVPSPFLFAPVSPSKATIVAWGYRFTIDYAIENGKLKASGNFIGLGETTMTADVYNTRIENPVFIARNVDGNYTITEAVIEKKMTGNPLRGRSFASGSVGNYDSITLRFDNDPTTLRYFTIFHGKQVMIPSESKYQLHENVGITSSGNCNTGVLVQDKLQVRLKLGDQYYQIAFKSK